MLARRLFVIALLACALGVVIAGCGGGDDDNTTSTANKDTAIQRCKDEAAKVSNPDVRKRAEALCDKAGTTSTPTTSTGGADRVQQCLDFVKQIPNDNARKRAEAACKRAG
jgi:hypothetical protein